MSIQHYCDRPGCNVQLRETTTVLGVASGEKPGDAGTWNPATDGIRPFGQKYPKDAEKPTLMELCDECARSFERWRNWLTAPAEEWRDRPLNGKRFTTPNWPFAEPELRNDAQVGVPDRYAELWDKATAPKKDRPVAMWPPTPEYQQASLVEEAKHLLTKLERLTNSLREMLRRA